ncbi:Cyanase [Aphelenchoides bicaudatus]|nr:Cyanase [Aphelenchoides bicaudatus]
MIGSREEVTRLIISTKIKQNLKWADVANALGQSKEWTTAACLGQMQLTKKEATQMGELFQLDDEAIAWLQIAPYKANGTSSIPTDPLLYRLVRSIGCLWSGTERTYP